MIVFYYNICYPDYTNPCFSDAKRRGKEPKLKTIEYGPSFFRKMSRYVILLRKAKRENFPKICQKVS